MLSRLSGPLQWYAGLTGLFLWLPALALPLGGGVFLQPLDLITCASFLLIVVYFKQVHQAVFIVLMTANMSWLFATLNGGSAAVAAYYFIFVNMFSLMVAISLFERHRQELFVNFFLIGGCFSHSLALMQMIFGADNLDLRNNLNFSLPPQYGRAFALFPEVSLFAAMSIPFVVILMSRAFVIKSNIGMRIFPMLMLGITLLNIAISRSTSVFVVFPIVALYAFVVGRKLTVKTVIKLGLVFLTIFLVITIFGLTFYADRLGDDAAARRSAEIRFASIIAALKYFTEGNFMGVGLGNNSMISDIYMSVVRDMGLLVELNAVGVNSFLISRIFEEGILGLLQILVSLYFLLKVLHPRFPASKDLKVMLLSFFLSATLVAGYRGLYEYWLMLIVPAALCSRVVPSKISGIQK